MNLAPWQGGRRLTTLAGGAGVAGLALTAIGALAFDARRALFSYLVAFVYWLGITLGALILLGAFHAANARWPVVLRRFVEHEACDKRMRHYRERLPEDDYDE
jgi:hypothetical protein